MMITAPVVEFKERATSKKHRVPFGATVTSLKNAGFIITRDGGSLVDVTPKIVAFKDAKEYAVYEDLKKWYLIANSHGFTVYNKEPSNKWVIVYKSEIEQAEALGRKLIR